MLSPKLRETRTHREIRRRRTTRAMPDSEKDSSAARQSRESTGNPLFSVDRSAARVTIIASCHCPPARPSEPVVPLRRNSTHGFAGQLADQPRRPRGPRQPGARRRGRRVARRGWRRRGLRAWRLRGTHPRHLADEGQPEAAVPDRRRIRGRRHHRARAGAARPTTACCTATCRIATAVRSLPRSSRQTFPVRRCRRRDPRAVEPGMKRA